MTTRNRGSSFPVRFASERVSFFPVLFASYRVIFGNVSPEKYLAARLELHVTLTI
jgi:hypothetical protein